MKKLIILLPLLAILFQACNNGDSNEITLNLEQGETYSYFIVAEVDISQSFNGMSMNQHIKSSNKVNYKVMDISDDQYTLEVSYEEISMYMDMGTGQITEIDSENPDPYNPASLALEKLKDQAFSIKVSKYGEIMGFEDLDNFVDKVIESLDVDNYMVKTQVRSFLEQTFSEETLLLSFEPMFNFYPAMTVREGDNWEKKNISENYLGKLEPFTYTLDEAGDSYKISGEGDLVEKANPKALNISGNEIIYHLNGEITSEFTLDPATGWVISGEIIQDASGDNELKMTALGGQEMIVPMSYYATINFSKEGFKK